VARTYEVGENGEVILSSDSAMLLETPMEITVKNPSISNNPICLPAISSKNQESKIPKDNCFSVKTLIFFCSKKIEYKIY